MDGVEGFSTESALNFYKVLLTPQKPLKCNERKNTRITQNKYKVNQNLKRNGKSFVVEKKTFLKNKLFIHELSFSKNIKFILRKKVFQQTTKT